MNISGIAPITFTTLDGVERKFRLTNSRLVRWLERKDRLSSLRQTYFLLWECLEDRGKLTEDDLIDLLPADGDLLKGLSDAILDRFGRDKPPTIEANEKYRPTKGETDTSTGSISPDSGEPTLAASESSGA